MKLSSILDSKIKKMDWLDVGLIKWSCIAFGVMLVILFPGLSEINIWWVITVIIILALRPLYRVYFS